ncbi:hypothetical protein ABLG96_20555 [Nakamurella sp. A5-74]|uniref:Uncharacterized protein n=1 Tax=Nakamurella sp. A5-74 TaxID=3158264 RepID=A0AAU8DPF5_9ACTN
MTTTLDFDAATRDLQQLVDALAAIEQDADFGPMFAGVWLEATALPLYLSRDRAS